MRSTLSANFVSTNAVLSGFLTGAFSVLSQAHSALSQGVSVIKQGKTTLSELESRNKMFQKILKASEASEYKFEEFRRTIKRESKDR